MKFKAARSMFLLGYLGLAAPALMSCGPSSIGGGATPSPSVSPSIVARSPLPYACLGPVGNGGLAYDPNSKLVIMFGASGQQGSNATWAWDGYGWSVLTPTVSPPQAATQILAYDPALREIILYWTSPASGPTQTWGWSYNTWHEYATAHHPGPGAMAYDPVMKRMVLLDASGTWAFDGADWTRLAVGFSPEFHGWALTFDPEIQKLVYLSNAYAPSPPPPYPAQPIREWTFDSQTWLLARTSATPDPLSLVTVVYYPPGRYLLGLFVTLGTIETWRLDESGWHRTQPSPDLPIFTRRPMLTYSEHSGYVIATGPHKSGETEVSGTWGWSGTGWQVQPSAGCT